MTTSPKASESINMNGEGETIPMQTRSKYKIDDNILNHELRRKLWDGMLPLRIELSLNDTLSIKRPSSLYVSIMPLKRYRSWRLARITSTSC
jgi:hypothetical protein